MTDSIKCVEDFLRLLAPHLAHSRARLALLINDPDELYPDESYDVDLTIPRFTVTWRGEVKYSGECQLIGTYYKVDNTWLWGWDNPDLGARISPTNEIYWGKILKFLASISYGETYGIRAEQNNVLLALKLLRDTPKFCCSYESIDLLARWIAVSDKWISAYPAVVGDSVVFLAVKLYRSQTNSEEQMCSFCGRFQDETASLLKGKYGDLCFDCQEQCSGILELSGSDSSASEDDWYLPSCILCGTTASKRIFSGRSGVCIPCTKSFTIDEE